MDPVQEVNKQIEQSDDPAMSAHYAACQALATGARAEKASRAQVAHWLEEIKDDIDLCWEFDWL